MVDPLVYVQRLLDSENLIFLFYYSLSHNCELWGPQISVTVGQSRHVTRDKTLISLVGLRDRGRITQKIGSSDQQHSIGPNENVN